MSIENAIASVAVKDLAAAARWYEKVFGRPADSKPMSEVQEWKFGRGGWLQVYQLPERAGTGSFTLAVTDVDEEVRRLHALGIDTPAPVSAGTKAKVMMTTDPDGNHIAFAQAIDTSMAR